MSIAYVGKAFVLNASSGTSIAVPMPSATAAGNKLYVFVGSVASTATGITGPAGFTLARDQIAGSNLRVQLYTRTAVGGDGGTTFTWTSGNSGRNFGYALAYSGVDVDASDLADANISTTDGSGPWATPNLAVADGDWLISLGVGRENPGTSTGKNWTNSDGADVERFDNTTASAPSINISAALWDSGRALTAGTASRSLSESAATFTQSQVWSVRVPVSTGSSGGGNPWSCWGIPMR